MKISGSEIFNHVNQPEIQQTNNRKISANLMQSIGLETDIMRSVRQIVDKVEIAAMQKMKANYSTVIVDGSEGNDEIRAKDLINSKLNGGNGDDAFYLSNISNSSVDGGEGDDIINIDHAKNVEVNGGAGNDEIYINKTSVRLHVLEPWEVPLQDNSPKSYIDGGEGNDTIIMQSQQSIIDGGTGDDIIRGAGIIDGGKGDDIINGSGIVRGGEGDDTISGYGTISGGTGDDIIRGSGLIKGDEGNDIINGAGIISGGTGNDIINLISTLRLDDYSGSANIIQYEKGDGHDIVNIANQDTILDMRSISKDEVDILESVNENTGYKELTVTMKDGSGSVTFISNNENDLLYANAAKVRNALEEQGLIPETPDKPVTFIPEYIHFSDGVVTMER